NSTLKQLDLSRSSICLEAFEAIALALTRNKTLENLILKNVRFFPKKSIAMANAIIRNQSLKRLDLSGHQEKYLFFSIRRAHSIHQLLRKRRLKLVERDMSCLNLVKLHAQLTDPNHELDPSLFTTGDRNKLEIIY
ncbi:MAG: hypothetical protein K940chlam3_01137, partial [Chlamydiae bacterium]|nr:hypothetical protein [Chlamydiota bacterium]